MSAKDKNVKKSPNLRFATFNEGWKTNSFGELVSFITTNSFSRENLNYENGILKNIHYGDIHTQFQTLFNITKEKVPFINNEINLSRISEDSFCKEGDIIFADASEDLNDVGKSIEIINLNDEKVLSGLHTLLARPTENKFEKGFLGYLLKSKNARFQIQKESQGSKVLSINAGRISKIHISYPVRDEQKKIADFFYLLDEKFLTQKKTIEDILKQKKYFSQKLFSGEIKLDNSSDWRRIKLGDLTHVVSKRNKESQQFPIYSINNKTGFVPQSDQFDGVDSQERGYDISLYKIINKNTFAYNPARINVGSIGYSGNLENIIISSLYVCFKTKESINDDFLFHYFKTNIFNREVLKNVEGGVRDYLFYENFSRIKINLPSLEEQKRIADFLSILDSKLDLESQILEKLNQQKKFFLQNLFV